MKVWVDCTAAAHPLVLKPIIDGLAAQGHDSLVTTRSYGQTEGILDRLGIAYESFGSHAGGGSIRKGTAVAGRSAALWRWAGRSRPDVALAHGSVDLAVVAAARRIPSVQMQDYEFAGLQRKIAWRLARTVMVPDAIPVDRLVAAGASEDKLLRYPGLKEDYYLSGFVPEVAVLAELGLAEHGIRPDRSQDDRVLVVVRPPPESSAYHTESPLYGDLIERLAADEAAVAVVIPRTERQRVELAGRESDGLLVPAEAIDAQSLIAYADLVVSAGGTMNREAVALGTPVFTIFSGRMGAVDEDLIKRGLLRPVENAAQVDLVRRSGAPGPREPREASALVGAVVAAATPVGG